MSAVPPPDRNCATRDVESIVYWRLDTRPHPTLAGCRESHPRNQFGLDVNPTTFAHCPSRYCTLAWRAKTSRAAFTPMGTARRGVAPRPHGPEPRVLLIYERASFVKPLLGVAPSSPGYKSGTSLFMLQRRSYLVIPQSRPWLSRLSVEALQVLPRPRSVASGGNGRSYAWNRARNWAWSWRRIEVAI